MTFAQRQSYDNSTPGCNGSLDLDSFFVAHRIFVALSNCQNVITQMDHTLMVIEG